LRLSPHSPHPATGGLCIWRLAHEVRPLESLTSELVEEVDREVAEQQAQTAQNIRSVERLVLRLCR